MRGGKARKVELETLSTLGDAVGGVLSSALNVVQKLIETRCSLCFRYGVADLFLHSEFKLSSVMFFLI